MAYDGQSLSINDISILSIRNPKFEVLEYDGKRIGNIWQGTSGWSEIHLTPGEHEFYISASVKKNSGRVWDTLFINASLEAGKQYQIKVVDGHRDITSIWIEEVGSMKKISETLIYH